MGTLKVLSGGPLWLPGCCCRFGLLVESGHCSGRQAASCKAFCSASTLQGPHTFLPTRPSLLLCRCLHSTFGIPSCSSASSSCGPPRHFGFPSSSSSAGHTLRCLLWVALCCPGARAPSGIGAPRKRSDEMNAAQQLAVLGRRALLGG